MPLIVIMTKRPMSRRLVRWPTASVTVLGEEIKRIWMLGGRQFAFYKPKIIIYLY